MNFYCVWWKKRFHSLPENFVVCDWKYIEFCKMVFFLSFRRRLQQRSCCFLYSLQEISLLLLKNVLQSLERFIIALCRSFVIDLLKFVLRYFFIKGACLLKLSVNKFRECWHSMLFGSHFKMLLSSSALNLLFQKFW